MDINKWHSQFVNRFSIIKEGIWVLIGQLLVAIVSLFGLRIITEVTSPSIFGEVTLWLGIMILLKNIFVVPVSNYQLRYYPEYYYKDQIVPFKLQIKKYYKYSLVLSSSLFLIVLILAYLIEISFVDWFLVPVLLIFFILDSTKVYYLNIFSAERKQFLLSLFSVGDSILVYLSIISTLLISNSVLFYLSGQAAGTLITVLAMFSFFMLFHKTQKESEKFDIANISSNFKKYALPYVPIAVLSWVLNIGNRYILNSYNSLLDVGVFTAAFAISSRPFLFLSGLFTNFFRPILFEKQSKNEHSKSKRIFNLWLLSIVLSGLLVLLLLFFLGSLISKVFLARDFRQDSEILFTLIGSGYLFLVMFQAVENRFMSLGDTKSILFIYLISALIYIAANLILIPKMGSIGAGVAISVSFLLQFIIGLFYLNRILKKTRNISDHKLNIDEIY